MKLTKTGYVFGLILLIFTVFPFQALAYETLDVPITEDGVISSFSISCSGTNATAILFKKYPFGYTVGEYMRRPCLNGIVSFDTFDLDEYIAREVGTNIWTIWLQFFKPPFDLVVKDTSSLPGGDTELVRIPGSPGPVLEPLDSTYPTLVVGSSFDFDGFNWFSIPAEPYIPPLPPEPIGDPNNLPAQISPEGNVPRVSINCVPGDNYTLTLVNETNLLYSLGVKQRILCGEDGVITFDGFNMNDLLNTRVSSDWWRYARTPFKYIIKNTTGIFECNIYYCPIINFTNDSNGFDYSLYLASSTVWQTVGQGPVYEVDETYTVWSNAYVAPAPTGNSNVMFFPGVMGSRLYDEVGTVDCGAGLTSNDCIRDDELWVSRLDSKHSKLALDDNGNSVNNIYTKDDTQSINDESERGLIDEAYGSNIYNSFINNLRNWKSEGVYNDYAFIPYDWRLSLEDIITNGASTTDGKLKFTNRRNFSESYILKKLQELQMSSDSGKVTLIGHSNGGLVIKALVQKLKDTNNPLYEKIDKIILVAVPQVGTPDALVALLHGKPITGGLVMTNQRSRELLENMPTIYNLIPSSSYFETVSFLSATSTLVNFENHPLFSEQIVEYGYVISNKNEMKNFVLATDGREKPAYNDTSKPGIGNSNLYSDSEDVHILLQNFEPASTTKVIQVAGWGAETISGIDYVSRRNYGGGRYPSYRVRKVIDGDGTVVVPSALWMSTSTPNVERWWVNLEEYSSNNFPDRFHGDILEISNLREFLKSQLESTTYTDTESIVVNNSTNLVSNEVRLHFTLHSPLTLGVYDSLGRYTGLDPETLEVKGEIPGVYYEQIGEVQFISTPNDLELTLKMKGLSDGSFSLDIDKQQGNTVLDSVSFQGIPSTEDTVATVSILDNMDIVSSFINIDNNGDGNIDKVLEIKDDNTVLYDETTPELNIFFDLESKGVYFSGIDNYDANPEMTISSTSVNITDNQNNNLMVEFGNYEEGLYKRKFVINKLIRNEILTIISNTYIIYEWKEENGAVSDLEIKVIINGLSKYIVSYKKSQNKTIIRERVGGSFISITKEGFVDVGVQTVGAGLLKLDY